MHGQFWLDTPTQAILTTRSRCRLVGRLCRVPDGVDAAVDVVAGYVDAFRAVLRLLTFGVWEVHSTAEGHTKSERSISVLPGTHAGLLFFATIQPYPG